MSETQAMPEQVIAKDLAGQVMFVTGGATGIGLSVARRLAAGGASVAIFNRNQERAEAAVQGIRDSGHTAHAFAADISNTESVDAAFAAALEKFGRVDGLVNNAGLTRDGLFMRMSDAQWDEVINTNLNAQWVLAREIGRGMVERGGGKIIFTASLLTFQGGITVPGYAAAKGAIGQLTKALANEWAGKGVQVNAIAPGYIDTDNTEALRKDPVRAPAILARIPAGRWGSPDDFKGAAVFLASRAADYVSGEILVVDGGWMGR
jgi:2-deoxy-D-gluconate 3-dehydrogenase